MKYKELIDVVEVEFDDGDKSTSDIVDITRSKELCDRADDEMVAGWIRGLKLRGYKVTKE